MVLSLKTCHGGNGQGRAISAPQLAVTLSTLVPFRLHEIVLLLHCCHHENQTGICCRKNHSQCQGKRRNERWRCWFNRVQPIWVRHWQSVKPKCDSTSWEPGWGWQCRPDALCKYNSFSMAAKLSLNQWSG